MHFRTLLRSISSLIVDMTQAATCACATCADADGCWSPKQDMVQVFGLRKVYKMPMPCSKRWWWPFKQAAAKQRVQPVIQQQQHRPQHFVAVADSWFGVPTGQLLCLLGPNGAGKTTSINCLIGEQQLMQKSNCDMGLALVCTAVPVKRSGPPSCCSSWCPCHGMV